MSRRDLLMRSLFGAGLIGLRSLATGLPIAVLADPRRALARARTRATPPPVPTPQFIILASSAEGDPLNANTPGSYVNPDVGHPRDPSMAPTSLTLQGQAHTAAKPWAGLPQAMLDRSCFFHHTTNTVIHPDEPNVLALNGHITDHEMLASFLGAQLAPTLGTLQADPIVLGPRQPGEVLTLGGKPEPMLSPASLATLLAPPEGALGLLARMRDADLDRLNAFVKAEGNPGKSAFIDQYARSQREARQLSDSLLGTLYEITDNSPESQIRAAVTLIRMKVSPVVSIHIPFGADNHTDIDLWDETRQTVSGVQRLKLLWDQLVATNMQDQVSFLSLNVFGRTLRADKTANGREHNGDHHVAVMFGAGFKGSVIGGIEHVSNDLGAMSLDSATGAAVANNGGDISRADTLQAMGLTFGRGVGLDASLLQQNISGGKIVPAALVTA